MTKSTTDPKEYTVEVDGLHYIEERAIHISDKLTAFQVGPVFIGRSTEAIVIEGEDKEFQNFVEPLGRSIVLDTGDGQTMLLNRELAKLVAKAILKLVDGPQRPPGVLYAELNDSGMCTGFRPQLI